MYQCKSEYDRQYEALQGLRDRLLLAPRNDYEHCITKYNNTVPEATTYRCSMNTHQPEDQVALPLSVLISALLALRHLQAENTCDDIGAETESSQLLSRSLALKPRPGQDGFGHRPADATAALANGSHPGTMAHAV